MHTDLRVRTNCPYLPLFAALAAFAIFTIAAPTHAQQFVTPTSPGAGAAHVTLQKLPIQHIAVVPATSGRTELRRVLCGVPRSKRQG